MNWDLLANLDLVFISDDDMEGMENGVDWQAPRAFWGRQPDREAGVFQQILALRLLAMARLALSSSRQPAQMSRTCVSSSACIDIVNLVR